MSRRADLSSFHDEAVEGLLAVCFSNAAFVRDALTDFTDAEIHTRIRPLLDGSDDAELGRLMRERARAAAQRCFADADVEALARRLAIQAI